MGHHHSRRAMDRLFGLLDLSKLSLTSFWDWIQDSELSFQIGATWIFPLLESIHVLSVVVFFASILTIHLKLLGITPKRYSPEPLYNELLPWAWLTFLVACLTGLGLFISRPGAYAENPAFLTKMGLLLAAGINLLIFHSKSKIPTASMPTEFTRRLTIANFQACLSIVIWVSVIFAGRWVGHIN